MFPLEDDKILTEAMKIAKQAHEVTDYNACSLPKLNVHVYTHTHTHTYNK